MARCARIVRAAAAAAALVGMAGCSAVSRGGAAARYEYRVIVCKDGWVSEGGRRQQRRDTPQDELNIRANQGWELVSVVGRSATDCALFLKRPAPAGEAPLTPESSVKQAERARSRGEFAPTRDVLRRVSPPGYTPYGQPPKPGEIRPPYSGGG